MWKPAKSVVMAGHTLSDMEVWLNEFGHAFLDLCDDKADGWLSGLALKLYPLAGDRAPRQAAKIAYVTRTYDGPC
ncbi:hypothetical protein ABID97_003647 [Variovorax sp. OAS795]|uniref:hypothetical protein n=1 Tax=Variovorax sp. OAS795 TaxID=3034231 RepID=UPI0033907A0B